MANIQTKHQTEVCESNNFIKILTSSARSYNNNILITNRNKSCMECYLSGNHISLAFALQGTISKINILTIYKTKLTVTFGMKTYKYTVAIILSPNLS